MVNFLRNTKPISALTSQAGYLTVMIEWLGLLVCMALKTLNPSEPASQYGYYPETKLIFGITFLLSGITLLIFAYKLRVYWRPIMVPMAAAVFFLNLMAWVPYVPNSEKLVLDIHTLGIALAALSYVIAITGMITQNKDKSIARLSKLLFVLICLGGALSITTRIFNYQVLLTQIFTVSMSHLWLIGVNFYLLKSRPS